MAMQKYKKFLFRVYLLILIISCESYDEFEMRVPFPGIDRIIYLPNSSPILYLSLNIDQILVVMQELTIAANENWGASCSIIPASEETGGYYIIMADKRLCGDGPNRSVRICLDNFDYPRNAIWYITRVSTGFHISRGNMCITKMSDEIGFKQKEEYAVQLRKCSRDDIYQIWVINHVDNLYY